MDLVQPRGIELPLGVRMASSTRSGGVSEGSRASLDLGDRDSLRRQPAIVAQNRERLRVALGVARLVLPTQVHGTKVLHVAGDRLDSGARVLQLAGEADALVTACAGVGVGVLTADCLPVLLWTRGGDRVAAAHAGWRGLAAGVLENTVAELGGADAGIRAWLGPRIGVAAFEIGPEVRQALIADAPRCSEAEGAFVRGAGDRWHADLAILAGQRLRACGVVEVVDCGVDVTADSARFYSHRRDRGNTGRHASVIWINP